MVQKIIWSSLAIRTYIDNISYLQQEWTQKEIDKFIEATERKLDLLKSQPDIGTLTKPKTSHSKNTYCKANTSYIQIQTEETGNRASSILQYMATSSKNETN